VDRRSQGNGSLFNIPVSLYFLYGPFQVDLKGSEFATLLAIIADHTHELPLPFGQLILTVNIGASEGRMMFTVLQLKSY
jgi:hypothetical protein